MKKYLSLLLALTALAALPGCGRLGTSDAGSQVIEFEAQTWRLSCSGDANSPEGQAAEHFADAVYSATNGAVSVEVCPDDRLTDGDSAAALQAVREREVDLVISSSQICRQLDPRLEAVSLPFLFSSAQEAETVLSGEAGEALADVLEEYQLRCLGIGEEGFRCPTNNIRPIAVPADMQGLKLRVSDSALVQEAYRLWGSDCLTAAWPMVFTALRTGTYDGQEEPLTVADAAGVQGVQQYLTRWTGIYGCLYFCMDRALYDSLSPALQEIAAQCGREAMAEQRRLHREKESEILAQWSRSGVTVTELTAEAAAEFRAAAQPCYDRFARETSSEFLDLFTTSAGKGRHT